VIQSLAGQLLRLIALVEELSLCSVDARLARLPLENSIDGVIVRRRWAPQTEIAAHLGTAPRVLPRQALKNQIEPLVF
jgi:hypothetical protein